jgi:glutamate synthase domain-containing protein 3
MSQPSLTSQITKNPEYLLYGCLFLLLVGGVIYIRRRQRKKKPPVRKVDHDLSELYEETEDIPEIKEEPKKHYEQKRQKKPKSLLDQDFEF